jgi:hypothetical protein
VKPDIPSMKTSMKTWRLGLLLLGGLALWPLPSSAMQNQVSREQDIVNLQLGQRVRVDDGTCPAGQIKEISGAKMTSTGVIHSQKCIPRMGAKLPKQ